MKWFIVFIGLLSGGWAIAQQELPKVQATFYCFRYAPGLEDVYIRTAAKAFRKIELSTANMIGPVTVVADKGTVTLHTLSTDVEGKTTYPLVAQARLGSVRRPLVLLMPSAKDAKLPYQALTLDRSDTRFPLGSYKFVNLSKFPIRAMIGKSLLQLKPGAVKTIKPGGNPGEMITVIFEYYSQKKWRPMTKTRWAIRPDKRILSCCYLDPADKRIKMRAIPERLVPVEPKKNQ